MRLIYTHASKMISWVVKESICITGLVQVRWRSFQCDFCRLLKGSLGHKVCHHRSGFLTSAVFGAWKWSLKIISAGMVSVTNRGQNEVFRGRSLTLLKSLAVPGCRQSFDKCISVFYTNNSISLMWLSLWGWKLVFRETENSVHLRTNNHFSCEEGKCLWEK